MFHLKVVRDMEWGKPVLGLYLILFRMQFFATIYKVLGRVSYYIVPLEFQCIVVIGFRAIKLENLVVGILGSKDSHDFPPAMPYAKIER